MEIPKLILLLCCTYHTFASHNTHIIPVEGYESNLQDLGQHVEIPETPVKVIKITKTVAVKIPVPYPVKVLEKVPYPVHVSKPYPVPVPQIIKVPHVVNTKSGHQQDTGDHGYDSFQTTHQLGGVGGNGYQEVSHDSSLADHSFGPESQSYGGAGNGHGQSLNEDFSYRGQSGSSYDAPASSYNGHSASARVGQDIESKNYDQAIKDYFNKQQSNENLGDTGGYHYHK